MKSPSSAPFPFFGKVIKDEYGCTIGRLIFMKEENSSGYILIEGENGKFLSYPLIWLKQEGSEFILLSPLKYKAEELIKYIPLAWRKNKVLEEISSEKNLPSEALSEIEKNLKEEFNRLKSEAQVILKEIETQIKRYTQQLKELNSAYVYLEIEHGISRISGDSFSEVKGSIQKGIGLIELKKKDLENLRRRLTNVMLGETETSEKSSLLVGVVSPDRKKAEPLTVQIHDVSKFKS